MDWQPIETAPKDGTEILIYDGTQISVASWTNQIGGAVTWVSNACVDNWYAFDPTHWMPLPEPPQT